MYYSNAILAKIASDKDLAMRLDSAVSGVKEQIFEQASRMQDGATRIAYYTSCFTNNYQDVCSKLKSEDVRFLKHYINWLKIEGLFLDPIHVYVELILKNKSVRQLENIKRLLMKMSVNISTSSSTTQSFTPGITIAICLGSNISSSVVARVSKVSSIAVASLGIYGYIQKAAESAEKLQVMYPAYYNALYMRKLEMMYFLVEPVFVKAQIYTERISSDNEIANTIARMVR